MSFRRLARPGIADVPPLDFGAGAAESTSVKKYTLGDIRQFPGPAHADGPAGLPLIQPGRITRSQGRARATVDEVALDAPIREDGGGPVQRIALADGSEVEVEAGRGTPQEILSEPDPESRIGGGQLEFRPLRGPPCTSEIDVEGTGCLPLDALGDSEAIEGIQADPQRLLGPKPVDLPDLARGVKPAEKGFQAVDLPEDSLGDLHGIGNFLSGDQNLEDSPHGFMREPENGLGRKLSHASLRGKTESKKAIAERAAARALQR